MDAATHGIAGNVFAHVAGGGVPALDMSTGVDELDQLTDCPQTPAFHGEGDVGTHTRMVVDQANALLAADPQLATTQHGRGATVLRLAALLHDVGKPDVTRPVDGRDGCWSSHGHADAGTSITNRLMLSDPWLYQLPLEVQWAVAELVRTHLWTYAADTIHIGDAVPAAHMADPALMVALWKADTRGRICDDADHLADLVGYAQLMLTDRHASTLRPWPWCAQAGIDPDQLDARVRRELLAAIVAGTVTDAGSAAAYVHARARTGTDAKLTWMFGLPGAGKSTWADRHADRSDASLLRAVGARARDRKAAHAAVRDQVPQLLREGAHVIVDATHLTRDARRRWVAHATAYGAAVECVYVRASLSRSLRRQQSRPAPDTVPAATIRAMADTIQWPYPHEYDTLTVVDGDA